jgi:dehydrogenase/reductase SDR family member 7B
MKEDARVTRYFKGKVIWITGASSGIGRILARFLSGYGASLVLSARDTANLESVANELGDAKVHIHPMDLTDLDSLEAKTHEAIEVFGQIDMLFNNAGISQRSYLHETSFDVIRRIMDVDFTGAAALTTYLLPHFYERREGHIVVTSSVMGKFGTPLRTGYCAAKHALQGFYEALATEAVGHGVAVTLLVPGWIRTDISLHALSGDGSLHGEFDKGMVTARGPEFFVPRMLRGVAKKRFEIVIALNWKTRIGMFLKRYAPALLRAALSRIRVT